MTFFADDREFRLKSCEFSPWVSTSSTFPPDVDGAADSVRIRFQGRKYFFFVKVDWLFFVSIHQLSWPAVKAFHFFRKSELVSRLDSRLSEFLLIRYASVKRSLPNPSRHPLGSKLCDSSTWWLTELIILSTKFLLCRIFWACRMPGMPLKVSDKRMQPALAEENALTSCNPGMVGRF